MKRILFLFSLIMMLGVCVNAKAEVDKGYCLQTVYCDINEDLTYICQSPIPVFNFPIASSFVVEDGYVKSFVLSKETLQDLHRRHGDYWDLQLTVDNSGMILPAYIRFVFVE